MAGIYAAGGACAVSVVPDPDHFGGDPADLERVRPAGLPVLRKDFIVDPYQVLESALLGADAVLLIARLLDARRLAHLMEEARRGGPGAPGGGQDEADGGTRLLYTSEPAAEPPCGELGGGRIL